MWCGHGDSKWQLNLKGAFFQVLTTYVQETELHHKKSHQSLVPSFDRLALVLFPKLSYLPDSLGFVAIYILAEVNLSSVFVLSTVSFE